MQFTSDELQYFANKIGHGEDIANCTDEDLRKFSRMLYCANMAFHMNPQQISQSGEAIRNEIQARFIHRMNNKNSVTTWAVIALTVASLIGSGFQVWYAAKAEERAARTEAQISSTTSAHRPIRSSSTQEQATTLNSKKH